MHIELQEQEDYQAMLAAVFNDNPDAIVVVNQQGLIVNANPRTLVLFGYEKEALRHQPIEILLPERFHHQHVRHRDSFFTNPQMRAMGAGLVLFGRRADGTEFPVDVMISPMHMGRQNLGIAIVRDITERKRLEEAREESEARFRAVAETASDALISCDGNGNIIYSNAAAQNMFGYRAEWLMGRSINRLIPDQDIPGITVDEHDTNSERMRELTGQRADAVSFPLELTLASWTLGGSRYHTAIIRDITQRKAQEVSLNSALREKETLLKEVYHRVKNNLQVIQSLLNLEARTLPEGPARDAMAETGARVRAMALVHEKLYQSGNLSSISLPDYIHDLVLQLQDSGAIDVRRIAVLTEVAPVDVGLDTAIPLGLLLNELVSNCIKHAFPDGRKGRIRIQVERLASGGRLVVSDDGIGLPADFRTDRITSMGLKLATSLAKQLDGRMQIISDNGTQLIIDLKSL